MPGQPYIHFTDEQKHTANSIDLKDFLRMQGETLERSGGEWRLTSHRGITVRRNTWYNHYDRSGGGPVQFAMEFYKLTYPEAMTMLLGGGQCGIITHVISAQEKDEPVPFNLPEPNGTMKRVYAYLIRQRGIGGDIVTHFANARSLYEDREYHNAVFVGHDENGVPKRAHKRGTYTGSSYRGDVASSDPRYGFRHIGGGDTLHVFEAPVDLLSYITMNRKDWKQGNYISLDGVTEHAMLWVLAMYPMITKVKLCLDNDPAGLTAAGRLKAILAEHGYDDVEELFPVNKDWNEDRMEQAGHTLEATVEADSCVRGMVMA